MRGSRDVADVAAGGNGRAGGIETGAAMTPPGPGNDDAKAESLIETACNAGRLRRAPGHKPPAGSEAEPSRSRGRQAKDEIALSPNCRVSGEGRSPFHPIKIFLIVGICDNVRCGDAETPRRRPAAKAELRRRRWGRIANPNFFARKSLIFLDSPRKKAL